MISFVIIFRVETLLSSGVVGNDNCSSIYHGIFVYNEIYFKTLFFWLSEIILIVDSFLRTPMKNPKFGWYIAFVEHVSLFGITSWRIYINKRLKSEASTFWNLINHIEVLSFSFFHSFLRLLLDLSIVTVISDNA